MIEELRKLVEDRISDVSGINGLIISDLDGVPILQASLDKSPVTDVCLRYQFTSAFASADEKCSKLNLKNPQRSLVFYEDRQILSVVNGPVVLTLIAEADTNTGMLDNFAKRMQNLVRDVSKAVIVQ